MTSIYHKLKCEKLIVARSLYDYVVTLGTSGQYALMSQDVIKCNEVEQGRGLYEC